MSTFRPRTNAELLDLTFALYRRHFPLLLTIALVNVLPSMLSGVLGLTMNDQSPAFIGAVIVLAILGFVANTAANGALVSAVSHAYLGTPIDAGTAFRHGFDRFWQMFGATFIMGLAIGVGFVLLIVPGVFLMGRLMVAPMVVMLEEQDSIGSVKRSWDLTNGSVGRILLLVVGAGAVAFALYFGLALIAALVHPILALATFWIILAALIPFFATVLTVLYYDLRIRREGYDIELMAKTATPVAPVAPNYTPA